MPISVQVKVKTAQLKAERKITLPRKWGTVVAVQPPLPGTGAEVLYVVQMQRRMSTERMEVALEARFLMTGVDPLPSV